MGICSCFVLASLIPKISQRPERSTRVDLDQTPTNKPSDALPAGTPILDLERYRPLVEGRYATQEAADAFLRSLWFIMCAFVDLGMDVKSSTENLPFMRELSSAFGEAAPILANTENQNHDRAKQEAAQEGDA